MTRSPMLYVLTLACLVGATACDRPSPGSGPTASKEPSTETAKASIDDATLTAKVKAALLAKSELNSTAISVTTQSGQVTLDGQLPPQQIAKAEQVARGVEGVRDVVNKLAPAKAPGSTG